MGKKNDEMLNRIAHLTNNDKSRLHILEETIPVNEQFEYFNYSNNLRENTGYKVDRNYLVSTLFTPEISIDEKRKCLSLLAGITDVAAYRAIETYHSSPLEPELANWSAMALIESRILINSDLTGEQQVFISTGLGGQNNKLRYICVIASHDLSPFTKLQEEIIEREFKFQFDKEKIETEQKNVESYYVMFTFLVDLGVDVKDLVQKIVEECNEYGHFLYPEVLITNTKYLSKEEIEQNIHRMIHTNPHIDSTEI